jgi:7-cyano-7-deazaguanine synthase in queuosine biosynthesis
MSVVSVVTDYRCPDPTADVSLNPGVNLRTGAKHFFEKFGSISSLENDLLVIASAVFAADLAIKRGTAEQFVREIILRVPVVNYHALVPHKSAIENILYLLSDDTWTLELDQTEGIQEAKQPWPLPCGKTLLFSGGLDSFAAAVDLLKSEKPSAILLVSHITANRTTIRCQDQLVSHLENQHIHIDRLVARVGGSSNKRLPFPLDRYREETQRTRSFMFMCLAALAARRTGKHNVVMLAENGQMAIHLPLTAARIGAFSTHTAHPEFIAETELLLSQLLGIKLKFENPYLYRTKAEVVSEVCLNHGNAIPISVSCWRGVRVQSGAKTHCGDCVPCLVRRIALESHNYISKDFSRDLFQENVSSLQESDEGKRNLSEFIEFVLAFANDSPDSLMVKFPDLISPYFSASDAIQMYKRFAKEAISVMSKYPHVKRFAGLGSNIRGASARKGGRNRT